MQLAEETTCHVQRYQLPDGRMLAVGAQRFMAPEALFSPDLISSDSLGLSHLVFACIQVRSQICRELHADEAASQAHQTGSTRFASHLEFPAQCSGWLC